MAEDCSRRRFAASAEAMWKRMKHFLGLAIRPGAVSSISGTLRFGVAGLDH